MYCYVISFQCGVRFYSDINTSSEFFQSKIRILKYPCFFHRLKITFLPFSSLTPKTLPYPNTLPYPKTQFCSCANFDTVRIPNRYQLYTNGPPVLYERAFYANKAGSAPLSGDSQNFEHILITN